MGYLPIFADGADNGVVEDFVVNQQRCLCVEDPIDATDNVARTLTKDQVCWCALASILECLPCIYKESKFLYFWLISQVLTVAKRCAMLHQSLLSAAVEKGADWGSVLASVESATAKADAKPAT